MIFGNARKINLARSERKDANFSSIVDIDDEAFESYVTDDLAGRLGEGDFFRLTMLLFIIANSIVIGLQTDQNLSTAFSSVFSALDAVFLAVFTMEILFKWYYGFLDFWKTGWNVVDFLLVFISFIGPLISFVESGRILLMIRIVRSFRSLRSISALNGMYTVLQTIMRSLPDMANIVLLLLIVMFIFAVVGVTIFGSILPERFGDLGSNMFTLFIIITQDGWVEIFDELEKRNQFVPAAIYFVLFIIIGAFVITNLIVAVVVTNLELTYANIKKANRQKYRNLKSIAMSNGPPPVTKTMNKNVRQINEVKEDIWKKQIPYEIPEFNRITQSKLETYFLILMIIEENLKEYVDLKEKLNEILLELKLINSDIQAPAPPEEDEAEDEGELGDAELDVGDPLSRLIRGK
ncbi:Ion transport protein-domain-containing protein [Paraphysoderma sedebokerense]|nr:Ion transport protein-domain-containing protein [Paraphysoderma sedebokerense]